MKYLFYQWPIAKRCFSKIFGMLLMRRNRTLLLLLGPMIILILYVNYLKSETTRIFAHIVNRDPNYGLRHYILYVAGSVGLKSATMIGFDFFFCRLCATSQQKALDDYMNLKWGDFKKYSVGDVSLRQSERSDSATVFLYMLFPCIFEHGSFLIQTLISISHDASPVLLLILVLSIVMHIVILVLINREVNRLQKDCILAKSDLSATVGDEIENFDIIKTYNLENTSVKKIEKLNEQIKTKKMNLVLYMGKITMIFRIIELMILMIVFTANGFGIVYIAEIYLVAERIYNIHDSCRNLIKHLITCNQSFSSFYTLELEFKEDIKPELVVIDSFNLLELKDISYLNTFSNINMIVHAGEKVGIFGNGSSGKSLIFRALMGFVDLQGNITINGLEINKIDKKSLYRQFTFVSQNESYVNGTVMENLKYGNLLNDEFVIGRCIEFGVHDAFLGLENGYNKHSKTGGVELSGGQRQRVNLMRGILRDTSVFLLDDCISNINTSDQVYLIRKILSMKNKTVIMAVKNYEFLQHFDKILYLNGQASVFGSLSEIKPFIKDHY